MWTRHLMTSVACATLLCAAASQALAGNAQALYDSGLAAVDQQNYAEALEHFRQAAAQGHRDAQRASGMMLMYGSSLYGAEVPTERDEAVALLQAAADAGCEESYFLLTRMRRSVGCV